MVKESSLPVHVGQNVFHPKSLEEYHKVLFKTLACVVMIKSEWCPVSKKHESLLFQLSKSRPDIVFVFVDMEKVPQIKAELNIKRMPTVFTLLNETIHSRINGASEYVEYHINEMEREKHLRELIYNNLRSVVYFHTRDDYQRSLVIDKKFDEYIQKYKNLITFEKFCYEDCPRLYRSVRATQCPCFCLFKGGKLKKRIEGSACDTQANEAIDELLSDNPQYDLIDLLPSFDEFLTNVDNCDKLNKILVENNFVVVGCFLQQDLNEKTPSFGLFASITPQAKCVCVDIHNFPLLRTQEKIMSVPTYIFYLNGNWFSKVNGDRYNMEQELKKMLALELNDEFKRKEKSHYLSKDITTTPIPQTKKTLTTSKVVKPVGSANNTSKCAKISQPPSKSIAKSTVKKSSEKK